MLDENIFFGVGVQKGHKNRFDDCEYLGVCRTWNVQLFYKALSQNRSLHIWKDGFLAQHNTRILQQLYAQKQIMKYFPMPRMKLVTSKATFAI